MRCRVLGVLFAAQLSFGCFALDLIDEGQKEMERYSGPSTKTETQAEDPEEEKKLTRADLQRWWSNAKTLSPNSATAEMVSCEIRGKVRFTTKTDCLTRGGRTRARGG